MTVKLRLQRWQCRNGACKRKTFVEQLPEIANGSIFYINAPDTIHRGIETSLDYRPFEGWRLLGMYTLNDQFFTKYDETIYRGTGVTTGPTSLVENRAGNKIPDVPLNQLTGRLGYDQPYGEYKGAGAFVEYVYHSGYTMDNANQTWAPAYGIVNLNVHYNFEVSDAFVKSASIYFAVNNVFDKVYIGSNAAAIADYINSSGKQSTASDLYTGGMLVAGAPRTFVAGLKLKLN